ncbi:isomerase/decarboxylase [Xylariaceae sp. FL0804]|nr:isomerase/decarboxylase [Xylariaceae sp. FL0804]
MKYHRVNHRVVRLPEDGDDGPAATSGGKEQHSDDDLFRVLEANPPDAEDPRRRGLPFQPRSYRDFMLFERHFYGAAVGMTRLYRPAAYYAGRLYSALTWGADFPLFRPHALWYREPIFYQSNHLAFCADGAAVPYPRGCAYLDVELELGVLLGRPLLDATPDEATAAIAGFCVFNDFSARNGQMLEMASGFGPQHSKAFANSISSTVVSADEILPRINHLTGRITINDKVVSEAKVDKWQFSVGEALAHASKNTQLYPGEFFGSGTFPRGCGIEYATFQLHPGDVVTLEIDGIGSVTNSIVSKK